MRLEPGNEIFMVIRMTSSSRKRNSGISSRSMTTPTQSTPGATLSTQAQFLRAGNDCTYSSAGAKEVPIVVIDKPCPCVAIESTERASFSGSQRSSAS